MGEDRTNGRLRQARQRANYSSAKAAAEAMGWTVATYTQHEAGIRNPPDETLERYARGFRVSFPWLKLGIGDVKAKSIGAPKVRFGGYIGAGQLIEPANEAPEELVEAVIGNEGGEAFEVTGTSMLPLAKHGDTVFFGAPQPPKRLIGSEAIVELTDGQRMFKIIERGSREGLYSLLSYNAEPIRDQEIVRAGPLVGLRRGSLRTP